MGDGIASLVHRAITDERHGQADAAIWEQGFNFVRYYHAHLTDNTTVYPGVRDGLGLLRALQLPVVVVTNKSEYLAVPLLEQLDLRDAFSLIIGGDTLAEKNLPPCPAACLRCAGHQDQRTGHGGRLGKRHPVGTCCRCHRHCRELRLCRCQPAASRLVIGNLAELYDLMKK
jgi:phosphoglycolate phosphatase